MANLHFSYRQKSLLTMTAPLFTVKFTTTFSISDWCENKLHFDSWRHLVVERQIAISHCRTCKSESPPLPPGVRPWHWAERRAFERVLIGVSETSQLLHCQSPRCWRGAALRDANGNRFPRLRRPARKASAAADRTDNVYLKVECFSLFLFPGSPRGGPVTMPHASALGHSAFVGFCVVCRWDGDEGSVWILWRCCWRVVGMN